MAHADVGDAVDQVVDRRRGSAVSSPATRRTRWSSQGSAANQTRAPQSPRPSNPGTSGHPTYTTVHAMRARLEGNTVARRQAPSAPPRYRPTTDSVMSNGIRNSANTLSTDSVAHPVGFGAVAPYERGSKLER